MGFLLGYLVILGLPGFPPPSSTQKLPYLVVLVAILAVVVALVRGRLIVASAGLAVLAIGGLLWLSGRRLGGGDILSVALALGPLWLGWLVILFRLARLRNQGQAPAVMVLVAALGLAGIGIFGASASVGQMALALAAAVGGYLLWNWPRGTLSLRRNRACRGRWQPAVACQLSDFGVAARLYLRRGCGIGAGLLRGRPGGPPDAARRRGEGGSRAGHPRGDRAASRGCCRRNYLCHGGWRAILGDQSAAGIAVRGN